MAVTPLNALSDGASPAVEPARTGRLRACLFASDLHLSPAIPRTVDAFERWIASIDAADVSDVYLLGDLFEFWIGDDMLSTPFPQKMARCLASLSQRGIRLFIMHGNRDFLLGKRFARAAGATLIRDPDTIEYGPQRWVLTHGDALCTDDPGYQRFRRIVRTSPVQCFFLSWPLRWRLRLGSNMRATSEQKGASRMHISDVNSAAVQALFASSGTHCMVQGHTHRPARHEAEGLNGTTTRWVLPDWEFDATPPRGGYLRLDETGMRLIHLTTEAGG